MTLSSVKLENHWGKPVLVGHAIPTKIANTRQITRPTRAPEGLFRWRRPKPTRGRQLSLLTELTCKLKAGGKDAVGVLNTATGMIILT